MKLAITKQNPQEVNTHKLARHRNGVTKQ